MSTSLNKKQLAIIDLHVACVGVNRTASPMAALCQALYISAKGTKHYYETLEFLIGLCEENTKYHDLDDEIKMFESEKLKLDNKLNTLR